MQNSTLTVKAKTRRSINQQIQVLCKKLVFSFTYLIAQCPGHTNCRFMSASAKCCLATEPANCAGLSHCTAYCCRSSISRLQERQTHRRTHATHTFTTGADIDRRPTAVQPHTTQFHVLIAVEQSDCIATHILLQSVRFTVWYSTQERHSCTE
jgi:hypothetical protein